MKKIIFTILAVISLITVTSDASTVRIRDVARVKGVRENQLTGYGIIVGLDGTGDQTSPALRSIINKMKTFGIEVDEDEISADNSAAVFVTATLPAFAAEGEVIDVAVSTMGDAQNLQGGFLLQTPLLAADGNVYAVAAGQVSIGGFNAGLGGAGAQRNHQTSARIPGGAIVEVSVDEELDVVQNGTFSLIMSQKSFANASRMAGAINERFGFERAKAVNPGEVKVSVPISFSDNPVQYIAMVEGVEFLIETTARVVINEKTGTVIMGADTKVSPVAISHGDISIKVSDMKLENAGLMEAEEDAEKEGSVVYVPGSTTVSDVVQALNLMGAKSRDIIAIFQALKSAGALHAELTLI